MGKKEKTFFLKADKLIITPEDIKNPWECDWIISMADDKEKIGRVTFAGTKEWGKVPIYIEIFDPARRNQGFGTEVLRVMKNWVFYHRDIYEIYVTIEHENTGAIMAFEKAGFVFREGTRELEDYSVVKQKTSWMGLYFIIGIVIGLILAAATTLTWVSMAVSLIMCVTVGALMDAKENAHRKNIMGIKK